ncbi:hypothetical protein SAMN02949497_4067 [Methylomagnum ishizawai]|uniref:Uncharacterized protein n=1 Tax=Methylomagnum ishizawai TaxID=1760988 RepID=A0A1Y6D229_9GAMM|nr:cytochrome oxidase putative small subunit CydP [Methylomagnum ishizawai]SMF96661.1 hypothetical protein SAMN02949497_4067 [Methylomagnum ishizawai]
MPNPYKKTMRPRLGREIAYALGVKVLLLMALWWAVFRPQPGAAKPDVADLFQPGPLSPPHQENPHDFR